MRMRTFSSKEEEEKILTDYSNPLRMTEIIDSKEERDFIDTSHSFKESQDDNITAAKHMKNVCLVERNEQTLTNEPKYCIENMRMETVSSKEEEEKILTDYSRT